MPASLIVQPCLLLLDEPAASLDPEWRARVVDPIEAERARSCGMLAIHDARLIKRLADGSLVVEDGRIAGIGSGGSHADHELDLAGAWLHRPAPRCAGEGCGAAVNGWEPHEHPHTLADGRKRPLVLALHLEQDWLLRPVRAAGSARGRSPCGRPWSACASISARSSSGPPPTARR